MLVTLGFISFLAFMLPVEAQETPTPSVKPQQERRSVSGLIDFSRILRHFDGSAIPVPKEKPSLLGEAPLSDGDIDVYRDIFSLQAAGKITKADRKIKNLSDYRLRGHVLYQRYMHPTAYSSSFEELQNWMSVYADHPNADKIYNLAMSRKPPGGGHVRKPVTKRAIARSKEPTMVPARVYQSEQVRSANQKQRVKSHQKKIRRMIKNRDFKKAESYLKNTAADLDQIERDILKSEIAARLLYTGDTENALRLAEESVSGSSRYVPTAAWVAGLVAWKKQDYWRAAEFFEISARSKYASGWGVAAGSYWAARSHMRTGNVREVSTWLEKAMAHPRTFYGLLATRALGRDFDFNWKEAPTFTRDSYLLLTQEPQAFRAMALVSIGQTHLAEAELLRFRPKDENMRTALFSYANYANLPSVAMRMASRFSDEDGSYYDAALYPKAPWEPEKGYEVDSALVHAIMRQESRFDPNAKSRSGARGLMQLMPSTASYVADNLSLKSQSGVHKLHDPEINLQIGQKYIQSLLKSRWVEDDILALLIAYNAGPGNLSKWKKLWPDVEDPLLFIELIPSGETRTYVERVLSNFWIYRMREGRPTPTMDAMAEGKKAKYASVIQYKLAKQQ